MTNRERAHETAMKWLSGSDWDSMKVIALAAHIEIALDEAAAEALSLASRRALDLMNRLGTDYRFEIADSIGSRDSK